jgi:hypothetical protein
MKKVLLHGQDVNEIWVPPLYDPEDVDAFKEMSSNKGAPFLLHRCCHEPML